jgi:hypothetical protein
VVLKNFIEKDILNPGQTLDDVIFVDKLGYLRPGTGIVTSEAFFEDVNLYYGSYGGWKLTGSVNVFVPSGSGLTVSTIEAVENSNGYPCFTSDGINRYRIVPGDGPVLTTGTTAHLTVVATLSDASVIVAPVTLEVIDIPAPTLYALSGAVIQNPNETGPGSGKFPYYELFAVTDQKPIFVWSTGEVASITLPAGYSWAYATEIFVYNSSAGPATLEVDTNAGHISLPSQMQATMEYSSLSDLGKLYTNASFISPVDFLEEYAGQKIAYRFYLQRIILNSQGKYNGIAAGLFDYIRYTQ